MDGRQGGRLRLLVDTRIKLPLRLWPSHVVLSGSRHSRLLRLDLGQGCLGVGQGANKLKIPRNISCGIYGMEVLAYAGLQIYHDNNTTLTMPDLWQP